MTTRIIAGLVAVTPLYVVGLLSSYFATRLTVTQFFGQSAGTYDHYFNQFLPSGDVLLKTTGKGADMDVVAGTLRTARPIMKGEVLVPKSVFEG